MLNRLNSHGIGLAGLAIGGGSIVASVAGLFKLLSDPTYLDALFIAAVHSRAHAATAVDVQTYSQLVASGVTIVGAVVVALLMTWLGRPTTVPSNTANAAAQAATLPPGKDT